MQSVTPGGGRRRLCARDDVRLRLEVFERSSISFSPIGVAFADDVSIEKSISTSSRSFFAELPIFQKTIEDKIDYANLFFTVQHHGSMVAVK